VALNPTTRVPPVPPLALSVVGTVTVEQQAPSGGVISEGDFMGLDSDSDRAVAIVTGGASRAGGDVARGLATWAWRIVIVYLDHQSRAEATIAEIIAAGGTTVAVRADLADDLDVQRLFTESIAAFGGVDVVVHTTTGDAALLYEHAVRYVSLWGAVVSTPDAELIMPGVTSELRKRDIAVARVRPDAVLAWLAHWRQGITG
jgi:NAD(P)-dependent dehydrogenase (short-subunit alcohol dehydrogenase family)